MTDSRKLRLTIEFDGDVVAEARQSNYLIWKIGAFVALIALAILIVREHPWTFSFKDALFWALILGMVIVRHVDARHGSGHGAFVIRKHVWTYALRLIGASSVVWLVAQAIDLGPSA